MNSCKFLGRLTDNLKLETTEGGVSMLRFSIAVSRKYKDKNKKQVEEVNFLNMIAWDSGAELIAKYFGKGDPIIIDAAAKQERWQKDGKNHSAIVFRVNSFDFVPYNCKKDDEGDNSESESTGGNSGNAGGGDSGNGGGGDDIPF